MKPTTNNPHHSIFGDVLCVVMSSEFYSVLTYLDNQTELLGDLHTGVLLSLRKNDLRQV